MSKANHPGHPLYAKRVKRIKPDKLIGYWALDDENTATCYDQSNQGNNGTYVSVNLAAAWSPFGRKCPKFDGSTSYVELQSAGLASDFSGAEATISLWANLANWADSAYYMFQYCTDADYSDAFYIHKFSTNYVMLERVAASAAPKITQAAVTGSGWKHLAGVVSETGDYLRLYIDGVLVGTPASSIGTYGDAPTQFHLGTEDSHLTGFLNGNLAHVALWNTPLSASEILDLSKLHS